MKIKIDEISGVEGNSLYINDFRVSGNKPWGGGRLVKSWDVDINNVLLALVGLSEDDKKSYDISYNGKYRVTFEKL